MAKKSSPTQGTLVVIPTYNEENYIERCVRGLVADCDPSVSILVVDGMSEDKTVELVEALKDEFPNLNIINNPKRLQSAAVNLAAEHYSHFDTGYLVRCDAHSIYPKNFVSKVVTRLDEVGSASVVVPMDAVGETCFQKANAWIVDTPLGSGGAAHRGGKRSGYVDHGHHAGFDLQWFRKVGGYDETFSHNEDAEYDHRVAESGGLIYLDADSRIGYVPRGSIGSLWRQYVSYGKGRARTTFKHGKALKLRQMLPVILVIGLVTSILAGFFHPVLMLPAYLYLLTLVGVSIYMTYTKRSTCGLWTGLILASMHIGWGMGFLSQLLKSKLARSDNRAHDLIAEAGKADKSETKQL